MSRQLNATFVFGNYPRQLRSGLLEIISNKNPSQLPDRSSRVNLL